MQISRRRSCLKALLASKALLYKGSRAGQFLPLSSVLSTVSRHQQQPAAASTIRSHPGPRHHLPRCLHFSCLQLGRQRAHTVTWTRSPTATISSRRAYSTATNDSPVMATRKAPYKEQDPHEIAQLVRDLADPKTKTKKGIKAKKTTFKIQGSPDGISVDSWRLQDWDYKRPDLPTYARGLFTTRNRRNEAEIAVRGYDKFFNVNEVTETKWSSIHRNTQGPYELTLKENGCIIFISGLEDGTLLVCSKHSTGDRTDIDVSHAGAGDRWIDKQLATIGKTREEFAQHLRERNITAVAELCDDDFEEHILAYGPERAGLYLHGININVPEFMTYPSDLVQAFADEWGFRKVGLLTYSDTESVQKFLDGVAESGAHDGRDVEGFVIRCRMSPDPERVPFADWFFKYKFEEPYLMYRQWRECTKALIAGKPPKYKKHIKITEEYLRFARRELAKDPNLGKLYNQNHGIIKLRDDFLREKNIRGADAANMEDDEEASLVSRDVVLVPIATIGCGKTTVGVALTHLFGWGIVQNDNIQGKGRPAQMVSQLMQQLMEHPVVVSDRNNSERREREQIIADVKKQHNDARLVALNFAHGDIDEVRRVTRERVLKRGDNHQTIQAASEESKVIGIMENFISRFQPCEPEQLPDAGFDFIIDLDPAQGSRSNVEIVVNELHKKYPALVENVPSAADMDEAVKAAIEDYTPVIRHKIPDRSSKNNKTKNSQPQAQTQKKPKPLEYMSVSVPAKDVTSTLETAFKGTGPEEQKLYRQLQQTRRVQPLFHVTLMHRASADQHSELWHHYKTLHAEKASDSADGKMGECDVMLESVVYDERIMAIVVRLVDPEGHWKCVNKVAHITIGTRDNSVKPKESNDLLARWLEKGSGGATGIGERPIEGRPILKGTVRGVLAR
ncbi:fungal tRNA ligase phosphodiesterase domain-domain-containing protein [Microdochium bolleyi]|uniref:Fungal tRNA ligase phosphodiesterase domain-domain-containing protein n=1 Tax=Microdochium bolleyi TaxID=196109 RepID=A0A136J368_9PEZI|nr:fungal tRNA ligase phosphodiesterase domain-domain-containing protein [Microdochium bolleyi]